MNLTRSPLLFALALAALFVVSGCGDAGVSCPIGQTSCGGACADTASDRANCGSCGIKCYDGQYCAAGRCVPCQNECMMNAKQCAPGSPNQVQICGDPDNDTCLEWSPAETCPAGQVCSNAQCVTGCQDECTREGSQVCDATQNGYHVCGEFDGDDCLDLGVLVECGANQACSNGQCSSSCTEECPQNGDLSCADPPANGVLTCGNYDGDGCREWGAFSACPSGETCDAGSCSSTCRDDCASGERICDGAGYRTCGNFDPDSCLDYSSITDCASWEVCQNGYCEAGCTDQCQSSSRQCSGADATGDEGFDLCADFNSDGCLEYGGHTLCGASEKCENGYCIEDCQEECPTSGQTTCQGLAGFITCGNYDGDSCLEWSPTVTECDSGEQCFNGACSSSCTSECTSGQKRCFGDGWQGCEQFSGDPSCWVWTATTSCSTDYVCDPTTFTCVLGCSNDCPTAGNRQCSGDLGGYQECAANWDSDPCLEWGSVVSCQTNYQCDQASGQCVLACSDECFVNNETQCTTDGSGYEVCQDHNGNGCLEWGATTACPSGQSCSSGTCSSSCSNECDTLNEIVCDGVDPKTYRVCVDQDSDPCYELSTSDTCNYGYVCQAGSGCVLSCSDDCSTPGERVCQSGRVEICAADHDSDECLEWGVESDCTSSGQVCYDGGCLSSSPPTAILINEILYDYAYGGDSSDTQQDNWLFVELYGLAGQSLNNYSVVGVQGSTSAEADYAVIPLDGYQIPSDGHFLIVHVDGHADLLAQADLVIDDGRIDLQQGPDSVQVRWAGSVVVDALGYNKQSQSFSASDRWAGEGASYLDAAPGAGVVDGQVFCLSRDALHSDTDVNVVDFWHRTAGNCSPGWEGPGAIAAGPALVFGGNSTPAIDNNGHIWTVDEDGWINLTHPDFTTKFFAPGSEVFLSSVAVDYGAAGDPLFYVGSTIGLYAYEATESSAAPYSTSISPVSGFPVQSSQAIYSTPAIGSLDGAIYFGTRSGGFFAYNYDGSERFWFDTGGAAVDSSPAIGQLTSGAEVVIFGTAAGQVYAVYTTGALAGTSAWSTSVSSAACHSSPALSSLGVFIGCDDGLLYGLNLDSGASLAGFPQDVTNGGATQVDGCSPVVMTDEGLGYAQVAMCSRSGSGNFYTFQVSGSSVTGSYVDFFGSTDTLVSTPAFGADGSVTVHAGDELYNYSADGEMQWYAVVGNELPSDDWVLPSPTWLSNGWILVVDPTSSGGHIRAVQATSGPAAFSGSYPMFHGDMYNSGEGW